MKSVCITLLLSFFLFVPLFTYAQDTSGVAAAASGLTEEIEPTSGFVPCSGRSCSACHFIALANTAIKWLITISFLFFAVLAVRAGIKLVISQGNAGALSNAKESFTNAFIGLIIILCAFLLVDTIMRQLVRNQGTIEGYGPWNEVRCTEQVTATTTRGFFDGDPDFVPTLTASGDNASQLSGSEIDKRVAAIKATPEVTKQVNAALDRQGITDPAQRKAYRALISQESSNCKNKVGPDTGKGRGSAYGCAQILVGTARELDALLDRRFVGKTNAQVAQILRDDNAYSIQLGAVYFKQGIQQHGKIEFALARYNGGPSALKQSTSCPGQRWYQCTKNTGYQQTRNYVANILAVAAKI